MGEIEAGVKRQEELIKMYGKGHCLEKDQEYENWDKNYGDGNFDYQTYILTDNTRPVRIKIGEYLDLNHQPYYVGQGQYGIRVKRSQEVGRNQDKYCYKTARINEMDARGGGTAEIIVGNFQTQRQAELVEKKLMREIDWSYLTNQQYHYCEIPLTADDCNVIYNRIENAEEGVLGV